MNPNLKLILAAWIGWEWDRRTKAMTIKLCPICGDFKMALVEAGKTPIRRVLCSRHAYMQHAQRLGESNP